MNIHDLPTKDRSIAIEAEQFVLGSLLIDNDALDRIGDLRAEHFYRADHRAFYAEIVSQILANKTCDVISLFDALGDKIEDCLPYLTSITQSVPSSANIRRHADVVVDRAVKRSMAVLGSEIQEMVTTSTEDSSTLLDRVSSKLDALSQKKTRSVPVRLSESLQSYATLLQERMEGKIKPISTGFRDLDKRLDGGFERGTLTVVAGRPGTGKTAFGLALCRNVATLGAAGFLSMEMDVRQVNDRNVSALGKLPISWLRNPPEHDSDGWNRLTSAYQKASELELYIDDETALNIVEIRNKARQIKRRIGLDLLVIDQLSFITGGNSKEKKTYELVGEHTRGLIAIAKQLDIAVVLLCQLNRECENRNNKRPQLSDLAMSGSIEQDAANVIFLYRDEVYNPDSPDKGICEVSCAKQRQGSPGVVALAYIAEQTRFEDLTHQWQPPKMRDAPKSRGLD